LIDGKPAEGRYSSRLQSDFIAIEVAALGTADGDGIEGVDVDIKRSGAASALRQGKRPVQGSKCSRFDPMLCAEKHNDGGEKCANPYLCDQRYLHTYSDSTIQAMFPG
jgi:hypothetical protein